MPPYELGNYFVMGYPPPNGSIVDLFADIFGPAPRYLVGLELMGLTVFGLIYLSVPGQEAAGEARRAAKNRLSGQGRYRRPNTATPISSSPAT